jgi:acyl-CoA thioester hydrolase
MPSKPEHNRDKYRYLMPIQTRWMDNDIYGHVNNVIYYSYFDTIANTFLIQQGELDIRNDPVIGYVVNSSCNYLKGFSFPDQLEGGFRVNRIGNSSVEYGIAIFKHGENDPSAYGSFTHVFVDRKSEQSQSIPDRLRKVLSQYMTK